VPIYGHDDDRPEAGAFDVARYQRHHGYGIGLR